MTSKDETRIIIGAEKLDHFAFSSGARCLRFRAYPVRINEAGEIRNFSSGSYDHSPLADLVISAQVDSSDLTRPYGFSVEYRDIYSLGLRQAEANVKLLRKVEKSLEKQQAELGYPETFAAYVARVGVALGVKLYGWTADQNSSYSHNEYRWSDATGISGRITNLTREWAKTMGIEVDAS